MSGRQASIVRLALGAKTARNNWLASAEPGAQFTCDTIARAMTDEVTLDDLLSVVQLAFDAGAAARSQALAFHIETMPLGCEPV